MQYDFLEEVVVSIIEALTLPRGLYNLGGVDYVSVSEAATPRPTATPSRRPSRPTSTLFPTESEMNIQDREILSCWRNDTRCTTTWTSRTSS